MRSIFDWRLASALIAGLVLTGASQAQSTRQQEGPSTRVVQPTPISVDEIVERIMAFDKKKKGKVTKEDLPERMHHLIDLGDTNKDGALDRDEVRKLAIKMASNPGGFGGRVEGFGGRVEGFGPDVGFGTQIRAEGRLVGPGPGFGDVQGVVDDLKLSAKKKDQATAAVKAHQEKVRKLMEQARGELLQKMKEILSEEEWKDFRAALDRPRGVTVIGLGPRETPRGEMERKLEQLQKELDDLRRQLRR